MRRKRLRATAAAVCTLAAAVCALAAAGPAPAALPGPAKASASPALARLMDAAGRSLLAHHVRGPGGGWAWRSVIQAPDLQTDRDVGAASVIIGLLDLYGIRRDPRYLAGARAAGDWLLAVAQRTGHGLRWPDFHDPGGKVSSTHFTSFDDGAAGIADALWRLGQATGSARYRRTARGALRWLEHRASAPPGASCPAGRCRWAYDDSGDAAPGYRTGIGEGNSGTIYALDVFAQRTGDRRYETYALAGARYLERLIARIGAMPWGAGREHYFLGFLAGSTGCAYTFLRLYEHTHDPRWLRDAQRLLAFVRSRAQPDRGGLRWPITFDPTDPGLTDVQYATGIEEGAAGVGWVELQAYHLTHDPVDLQTAIGAGNWLLASALPERGGLAWPEDLGADVVHTSLDNGAPGIGWFLDDLARETGDARFATAAQGAVTWLSAVAGRDRRGVVWFENRTRGRWSLPGDPSWHWGLAGIAAFLARMDGLGVDSPGEEPGLPSAG
ncbi:MAG: hypothetical protein E6G56_11640 [Actinobacteria bacterium]|nr:MAG: hypothetical protein E6G56_11640 [Actinomycetota bacterium]